jgi:hypothetical protein
MCVVPRPVRHCAVCFMPGMVVRSVVFNGLFRFSISSVPVLQIITMHGAVHRLMLQWLIAPLYVVCLMPTMIVPFSMLAMVLSLFAMLM